MVYKKNPVYDANYLELGRGQEATLNTQQGQLGGSGSVPRASMHAGNLLIPFKIYKHLIRINVETNIQIK